jgi:AcrR family transcriptional regulator
MSVLNKTKKDVVTEFRMAELLEAARRVFAAKGFHDATMDDIAEIAGVAKGTVYSYYHSKRAVYWAALQQGVRQLLERMQASVETGATIEERLRAIIATKISFFHEDRDFFRIYFSEFGNALAHPAQINQRFQDFQVAQIGLLEGILEEALRNGEIRDISPNATANAIADVTRGVIRQRLVASRSGNVADDIEFVFQLIWKGIAK